MAWITNFISYITGNEQQTGNNTTNNSVSANDIELAASSGDNHLKVQPGIPSIGLDNKGLQDSEIDLVSRGLDDSESELNQDQPILSFSRLSYSLETRRLSKLAEKDHWITPPPIRRTTGIPSRRAQNDKAEDIKSASSKKRFTIKGKGSSCDYETVEIKRGIQDELGFKIEGGLGTPTIPGDPGIFVKYTIPGSPSHQKLNPGDRILSVNDVNISRVTRRHAKEVINNATGSTVALYVKRASPRQQMIESALHSQSNSEGCIFTKEQIEEFEDAFSMFNKDQSGLIRTTKVFSLIRSLGHNPAEHAVWVYLNDLGLTANCKLTFQDFVDLMTVIVSEQSPEYEISSASNVFDTDERGFVTVEELHEAFERMPGRERMKEFELKEIINKADPAGRGIIRLKEFENLLQPSITLY